MEKQSANPTGIFFIFHGKRKKEGGSAPSSDLPCKGASPLDPFICTVFFNLTMLFLEDTVVP
ncbi:hypothetical protein MBAV_001212 [Candidatus Magnetobacterium bavaricum]|uniref:Uncharacterized protein n=1 Tax=Candidatus Magnetobacterium bavaricum TaxID=29290 RepID=A0A0F3GX78_9BACT|nr:hypothetical protein MBAV_001212 [Candidatus Magnetobacterium bavaricum]